MPRPVFSTSLRGLLEVLRSRHRVADGVDVAADVDRDDVGALFGEPDRVATALPTAAPVTNATLPCNASHWMSLRWFVFG